MPELAETLASAREAAMQQRFEQAADLARSALHACQSCLLAHRILAWAQLRLGDDGALTSFQQCAQLDPEDALAEVGQAMCHEAQGAPDVAVAHFLRAWELDPQDQRIRKEVVRLGEDFPDSPLADGIAALNAGRADAAVGPLRQAAANNPNDLAAPLALATALWRVDGKQQAHNLASTVLAVRPYNVKALLYVLAVEADSGHLLRTRELAARAEQVDPDLTLHAHLVKETGLAPVLERLRPGRQTGTFSR